MMIVSGCSKEDLKNRDVEKAIFEIIADQSSHEINLLQLTDFEWEHAYLFAPYTDQEQINETLGFEYNDKSQIANRDDIYLLVFVKQNKVIAYAEMDRQQADFTAADNRALSPEHPSIIIER